MTYRILALDGGGIKGSFTAGVLAWYEHPISTGPLEGVNNKVKRMKRVAYGYRDEEQGNRT